MQKIPYMFVVGGREAETRAVSLRARDGKTSVPSLDEAIALCATKFNAARKPDQGEIT